MLDAIIEQTLKAIEEKRRETCRLYLIEVEELEYITKLAVSSYTRHRKEKDESLERLNATAQDLIANWKELAKGDNQRLNNLKTTVNRLARNYEEKSLTNTSSKYLEMVAQKERVKTAQARIDRIMREDTYDLAGLADLLLEDVWDKETDGPLHIAVGESVPAVDTGISFETIGGENNWTEAIEIAEWYETPEGQQRINEVKKQREERAKKVMRKESKRKEKFQRKIIKIERETKRIEEKEIKGLNSKRTRRKRERVIPPSIR